MIASRSFVAATAVDDPDAGDAHLERKVTFHHLPLDSALTLGPSNHGQKAQDAGQDGQEDSENNTRKQSLKYRWQDWKESLVQIGLRSARRI